MAEVHASADVKRCTRCHVERSLVQFHRSRTGRLGRHSVCKNCHRERWSVASGYVSPSAQRRRIESAARKSSWRRECRKCGKLQPQSAFSRSKSGKLRTSCEPCREENRLGRHTPVEQKTCVGCAAVKPASEFYRRTDKRHPGKSYLASRCKACWVTLPCRTRARRIEDRRRAAARKGKGYRANPSAWKENQPSSDEKTLRLRAILIGSTIRAWQRFALSESAVEDRKRKNRLAYQRRYKLHRESEIRRSRDGKRIRRESLARAGLSELYLVAIRSSCDECEYCGRPIAGRAHVDHVIPLSQGGTSDPANLAVVCAECNLSKGTASIYVWAKAQPRHIQERVALFST